MASEIQVNTWFLRAIRRWPLVVGIALMGGVFGFLFNMVFPERFEAKATMAVNIHYGITEPLKLVVEDRVLNRVAAIIQSEEVITKILDNLEESIRSERKWREAADLEDVLRLDRRLAEWDLVAMDRDPNIAAIVAQAWADAALPVLDDAYDHAWKATKLIAYNPFQVGCVPTSEFVGNTEITTWSCSVRYEDLDPETLTDELRNEIALSRGMLPNISYELIRESRIPTEPVIWARGTLILAGALIGLFLGFWGVVIRDN